MMEELRELWRYRELLFVMVQRELRVRYKNSALGFLWSFLNPLLTTLVMTLVFGKLLKNDVDSFAAYVLAALLPFTFFSAAVLDSAQSVLSSLPIIKKVYLPRELLPLSIILGNFVHLIAGFVVFFLYLLGVYAWTGFAQSPFRATSWMLPPLMLVSLCLATGVGLLVSALNTFYEDVKYLAGALLYLLTFLCPIVYFHETIAESLKGHVWLYRLYMLNPLAVLSVCYRKALLAPAPIKMPGSVVSVEPTPFPWLWLAYTAVLSVALLWFGYSVFNRAKWRFVERP
jgi:ABC-type polysaccharide/polyol phosphate export permease